jgi:phospho-N-acetylmuramoyl-pentapeptide-transferase
MFIDTVKIVLPPVIAFWIGIGFTPILTTFLYKNKMWKKKSGKIGLDGSETTLFNKIHQEKEVGTPRMGGIVIWFSATVTIVGIWFVSKIFPTEITQKIDFLSRDQTWIAFFAMILGSLVGLVDDYLEIKGGSEKANGNGGLSLKKRLFTVTTIGLLAGLWFYLKLDVSGINLPWWGILELGWLFVPFFALVTLAIYSGGVIDGIDGLAGGIMATIFAAYSVVAFSLEQINLAAFCAMISGSILAFLWFNIPPARFYMSETGTMGLTMALAIVAFMTDTLGNGFGITLLPIIALPLVATSLSNIIQVTSKRFRGKKVFLIAPIHHHFEAIGWPPYKVTMRFWVIGVIFALIGVILALTLK